MKIGLQTISIELVVFYCGKSIKLIFEDLVFLDNRILIVGEM